MEINIKPALSTEIIPRQRISSIVTNQETSNNFDNTTNNICKTSTNTFKKHSHKSLKLRDSIVYKHQQLNLPIENGDNKTTYKINVLYSPKRNRNLKKSNQINPIFHLRSMSENSSNISNKKDEFPKIISFKSQKIFSQKKSQDSSSFKNCNKLLKNYTDSSSYIKKINEKNNIELITSNNIIDLKKDSKNSFKSVEKTNSNKVLNKCFGIKNGVYYINDFKKNITKKDKNYFRRKNNFSEDSKTIDELILNNKLLSKIEKENNNMHKKISKKYEEFEKEKKIFLKNRPNEETFDGFCKIFSDYNKKRSKKHNIVTNRLIYLNGSNDNDLENFQTREMIESEQRKRLNNVLLNSKGQQIYNEDQKGKKLGQKELTDFAVRANRKVEKLFPDLFTFNLPKVLKENKDYTMKLLYDVFIEFKTLLKFCILFNNDINIHKKGIDFSTFFNCNIKINQQGYGLSKKIYKTLNGKLDKKYMTWGNYIDGLMKIKEENKEHKMDLFFRILDENGDGSLDYNEVYNLSLVSLQRTLPQNPLDFLKKPEEVKKNEKEIIDILAEFFSKLIFSLVNIDINDDIPIDVLRQKMQEGGEATEYLEMFLCADNFA